MCGNWGELCVEAKYPVSGCYLCPSIYERLSEPEACASPGGIHATVTCTQVIPMDCYGPGVQVVIAFTTASLVHACSHVLHTRDLIRPSAWGIIPKVEFARNASCSTRSAGATCCCREMSCYGNQQCPLREAVSLECCNKLLALYRYL